MNVLCLFLRSWGVGKPYNTVMLMLFDGITRSSIQIYGCTDLRSSQTWPLRCCGLKIRSKHSSFSYYLLICLLLRTYGAGKRYNTVNEVLVDWNTGSIVCIYGCTALNDCKTYSLVLALKIDIRRNKHIERFFACFYGLGASESGIILLIRCCLTA